jgi:hypothetical protein
MTVTFKLTAGTSGTTQSGNYIISGTTNGGALNGVFIASGITRSQLIAGHQVTGISDSITGVTITSTGSESGGYCTNSIVKPINGSTEPGNNCWCVTYSTVDSDLYVRYRDVNADVITERILDLETMDNGNGTFTGCICVYPTGAYSTPVCVQGGIEVTCPESFIQGSTCTTAGPCFIG